MLQNRCVWGDFGMFTPPGRAALAIFTDNDAEPHVGARVAALAALTQLQHALTQFVAHGAAWTKSRKRP